MRRNEGSERGGRGGSRGGWEREKRERQASMREE